MSNYDEGRGWAFWTGLVVVVAFVITILCLSVYSVAPGNRGVLVTLGEVAPKSYTNGVGFKVPFVSTMYEIDVRTQTFNETTASYTSDVQTATIEYTLTYELVPENVHILFEKVGLDYETKKLVPVLNDVLKDVIGKWQAQDLVANRDQARVAVLKGLKERLDGDFFTHITFQFINIDYSDNFEKAIENKVIAEQKAQEAANYTRRVREEAEQKLISAKAEAEAMEIKSQALAKNKGLVEYEAVQKWDGKLPTYMGGNSVPMINIAAK